jgi:hypothetical protein
LAWIVAGQDLAVQLEKLSGCDKVFKEKRSGVDAGRPELKRCLEYLREGDTLLVTKLDRLVRSAQDLYRTISQLDERVVGLRLSEITRRVCRELDHGLLAAEAIGLALNLRIDGAVGLYVFAGCEAHCAHVAELAGHSQSRRRA